MPSQKGQQAAATNLPLIALVVAAFGAAVLGIYGAIKAQPGDGAWLWGAIGLLLGGMLGLGLALWAAAARQKLSQTEMAAPRMEDPLRAGLASSAPAPAPSPAAAPSVRMTSSVGARTHDATRAQDDELRQALHDIAQRIPPNMPAILANLREQVSDLHVQLEAQAQVMARYASESEHLLQQRLHAVAGRVDEAVRALRHDGGTPQEQWLLMAVTGSIQWTGIEDTVPLRSGIEKLRVALEQDASLSVVRQLAEQLTILSQAGRKLQELRQGLDSGTTPSAIVVEQLDSIEKSLAGCQGQFDKGALGGQFQELRGKMIELLDREYRYQMNSGDAKPRAISAVREGLDNLDLVLIEVSLKKTAVDPRYHQVSSSESDSSVPPGTILQVNGMGYIDKATGAIVRASVIATPEAWS